MTSASVRKPASKTGAKLFKGEEFYATLTQKNGLEKKFKCFSGKEWKNRI